MRPIADIARLLDLSDAETIPYGPNLAKLSWAGLERLRAAPSTGKLVLVSAMTPTKYGEGKTTTSIGLTQGLRALGVRAVAALREPSLGPVFGAKGGGTGGGRAMLLPSTAINLHCTGDLHAITAANNLLAALADNALHFRQADLRQVTWGRCLDINDRPLRSVVIGLGSTADGVTRQAHFDITAASEVMATLCMADGLADLKSRLSRLIVGLDSAGQPVTAAQLNAVGPMTALLRDALLPNLAQTTDGAPAFIHGGPFANIAHGCNSVAATRAALALSDVTVTEAGFAFDLGGEKFLDLKCRRAGLWPSTVVLVCTVRALRAHGGDVPGLQALQQGFGNLERHVAAVQQFGLTPVVALNVFADDSESELLEVERLVRAAGARFARNDGFARGAEGSVALGREVLSAIEGAPPRPRYTYALEDGFEAKVNAIATKVYGAEGVDLTAQARRELERLSVWGLGGLPVCMAKTHLSLSDDPIKAGAPRGFRITIRSVRASPGAGFLLALTGDIMTMPGLPRTPAAGGIDVLPDGTITGVH